VLRIALISDLHANQIALREVLRSIREHGADEIICLGDVATLGVAPCEVIETLRDLGCRCITGNHDDYMLDPNLIDSHTNDPMIIEANAWSRDQLSPDQFDFLRSFEESFELPLGDHHRLMLYHGPPDSNMVALLAETPPDTFDELLGAERATVMAGGHTHIQMLRQHRGTLVVNPGSVGAPFREFVNGNSPDILSHAEYATVDLRGKELNVTLHHVDLDRHELAKAALETSNPMSATLAAPYL